MFIDTNTTGLRRQNVDKCDERRQLSVEQERALELIILGQNDREVAESLSIARQTVHKWRNYNPLFNEQYKDCFGM